MVLKSGVVIDCICSGDASIKFCGICQSFGQPFGEAFEVGAGIKTPITRVIAMRLRFTKLDYALCITFLAVSTKTPRSE
jgi:hypothetical protein